MPHTTRSLARWLVVLCCATPLGAAANPRTNATARAEPQEFRSLCWAATSATVVNAFMTKDQYLGSLRVTQPELAGYAMANTDSGRFTPEQLERLSNSNIDAMKPDVNDFLADCKEDLLNCNKPGVPILKNLRFEVTAPGTPLSWCDIDRQVTKNRPVLFGLEDLDVTEGPSGLHFFVLVDRRIEGGVKQVQVWDPWPARIDRAFDPADPGDHLKWIDYQDYAHPGVVWGVDAKHQFDRYSIRKPGSNWNSAVPLLTTPCDTPEPVPVNLQLESLERTQALFTPTNILNTVGREARIYTDRGLKLGKALPIVGLTRRQIVSAGGNADQLIVPRVSSVLVPVEDGRGKIVDAFLCLNDNGRWVRRGYADTGFTRVLAEVRRQNSVETRSSEDGFYVVAVPYRETFFLGKGTGAGATLVPAATYTDLGARRGVAEQASRLMGCLAELEGATAARGVATGHSACRAP